MGLNLNVKIINPISSSQAVIVTWCRSSIPFTIPFSSFGKGQSNLHQHHSIGYVHNGQDCLSYHF